MESDPRSYISLIQNAALLLSMALVFDIAIPRRPVGESFGGRSFLVELTFGLGAGAAGMVIMATPWVLVPGIVFDTRSVLLGISGLFFGTLPTLIAMAMTAAYRFKLGGGGALTGVSVIVATAVIGIVWRRARANQLESIGWLELLLFGLVIHAVMLLLMFTLPGGISSEVLAKITLPVLAIYPAGTALLGVLIRNRLRRRGIEDELRRSESRLNDAQRLSGIGGWEWDAATKTMHWSDEVYRIHGLRIGDEPAGDGGLIEKSLACFPEDTRASVLAALRECSNSGTPFDLQSSFMNAEGKQLWIRALAHAVFENGRVAKVVGTIMDITYAHEAEAKIAHSLKEKETLLRELYHRTKNNMQVISSMLELEADSARSQETKTILHAMSDRIVAMALVHQMLYRAHDLSHIQFDEYVRELMRHLVSGYVDGSRRLDWHLELEPVNVLIDVAMPAGLILNELVSNSLKYAFPSGRDGEITIGLRRRNEGEIELEVSDNGIGVPADFDFRGQSTLGLQTILALAEHQLQGKATFSSNPGFRCVIRFAAQLYTARV